MLYNRLNNLTNDYKCETCGNFTSNSFTINFFPDLLIIHVNLIQDQTLYSNLLETNYESISISYSEFRLKAILFCPEVNLHFTYAIIILSHLI